MKIAAWFLVLATSGLGQVTTIVSVDSNGIKGNKPSWNSAISRNGRFISFESIANNLVPGDTNQRRDVFVHDRLTGSTTRVSVSSSGREADGDSWYPSISADGARVAFHSYATNLVQGDHFTVSNVFLHDLHTGQTTRMNVSQEDPAKVIGDWSNFASISGDGRFVAFSSLANDLVPDDNNAAQDIFLRGPEFTLESDSLTVRAGQPFTLTMYKGLIHRPASIWAVMIDGVRVSSLLFSGRFAADGTFACSAIVPQGISDHTIAFRGLGREASGCLTWTNDLVVSFK